MHVNKNYMHINSVIKVSMKHNKRYVRKQSATVQLILTVSPFYLLQNVTEVK